MWAGQDKISERLGLTDGVIYLFFLFITVFVNSAMLIILVVFFFVSLVWFCFAF